MNYRPDNALKEWMRDIRREIHQYPELAFEEKRTAQLICKKLEEIGVPYSHGIARTGVLGRLGFESKLKTCVALRADMDALPIEEKTGLPFSSR